MKKFISFAFAAMMLVAVTSCGSKTNCEEEQTPMDTAVQVDTTDCDTLAADTVAVDSLVVE